MAADVETSISVCVRVCRWGGGGSDWAALYEGLVCTTLSGTITTVLGQDVDTKTVPALPDRVVPLLSLGSWPG